MNASSARFVDVVAQYIGCSCKERCDELATLCARGVDTVQQVKAWLAFAKFSNCGHFALGVWHAAGVSHPLLERPYSTGEAIAWLVTIAHVKSAVRYPKKDGLPPAGALLHYWLRDGKLTKSHHVEFCMSEPTIGWHAAHAGGGRPHCEIGHGEGDLRWNAGRPLQCWYDPESLLEVQS